VVDTIVGFCLRAVSARGPAHHGAAS
jgi:hypothetical protein